MVDVATQAAETPEPNFDDAFAQLANLEQSAFDDGEVTPKKPEEAPAPAETAEAAPAAETSAETPPAETPPAETPPAEAPKEPPPSSAVLDRLEQLLKEVPAAPAPAAPAAPAPQEAPPLFTNEEVEYLQNYEKDWPDVARANALIRRAENQQVIQYVFNELAKEIRPLMETVQLLAHRSQLSDLTARVPDYDATRDQVIEWVGTQPEYLQAAYNRVIAEGSVEEVADLIGRYKRETGAPAATAAPAPTPKKTDTELPPATKQAAAALAPVSSKRTVVPQTVDPSDFEAAFASFASKL